MVALASSLQCCFISIPPFHMGEGNAVEFIAVVAPVGHEVVHQGVEAGVMAGFEQVCQFMNNDVFKALARLFGKVAVEADTAGAGIATAPFGLHALHVDFFHLHAHDLFPVGNQGDGGVAHLFTIPGGDDRLLLFEITAGADRELHVIVFQLHGWNLIRLVHFEQIAPPPNIMAFPVHIVTRSFAFLRLHLGLMAFDPVHFGDDVHAQGIEADPPRRGDAHPARGRVDAEVDVLDILEDHVHGNVADLNLLGH